MSRRERRAVRQATTEAIEQARPISLVASAAHVTSAINQNVRWGVTDWQAELWQFYDLCSEFHAGVDIKARALSRARIIAVDVDPVTGEPGTQRTTNEEVSAIGAQLFGSPAGQGQALEMASRHLDVAGEFYVYATDRPDEGMPAWQIIGNTEVQVTGRTIMITQINNTQRAYDPGTELLFRVWKSHPARRWEADSNARALLPVLRELAALDAMVSSTVKSRLASAGILWLPDELQLPTAAPSDEGTTNSGLPPEQADANAWLEFLTEAMTAPINDPDSAAAVVPIVATVNAELIEKINHMQFGRDLDAVIEPLREADVKRIAVGLPIPPEYLLGTGDVNHWTGWLITEDFARVSAAPSLELIIAACMQFYQRPALSRRGIDADLFALNMDLSALVPRQVSVENAAAAYASGLLSDLAYMEALGFGQAEMATPEERARRLIVQLMTGGNADALGAMVSVLQQLFPSSARVIVPELPAAPVRTTITEQAPTDTAPPTDAGGPPPAPPGIAA